MAYDTFHLANASWVTDRLLVGGDLAIDNERAKAQLAELIGAGVTHIVDCRIEADETTFLADVTEVTYLHHGMHDAGQRVPEPWFDVAVDFALRALEDPRAVVLTHCHMGVNRGPSVGYAVLLGLGWDPVDALAAIRSARPIANVWYAEDALRWYHGRTNASPTQRRLDLERLTTWRERNRLDTIRIIADARRREV